MAQLKAAHTTVRLKLTERAVASLAACCEEDTVMFQ